MNFDTAVLAEKGLNLQAVFSLTDLPKAILNQLSSLTNQFKHYNQLILIGHGGTQLWQKVRDLTLKSNNPIDDYSRQQAERFFNQRLLSTDFEVVFPALTDEQPLIGLQALGELAGWHNTSPFRVGINQQWGSWFAYRAVVLANSHFPVTVKSTAVSPCTPCKNKPCVEACPANALKGNDLDIDCCISYRKQTNSLCKDRCLARMACPVSEENQYELEQIQYHYSQSMQTIKQL